MAKTLVEPNQFKKAPITKQEVKNDPKEPKKDNSQIIWLAVLIVVTVGAFMVWNYYKKSQQSQAESL